MKVLLKNELNRAFKNKWFLITLVICSMIIIYDICTEIIPTRKQLDIYVNTWGWPIPNIYNRWIELGFGTAKHMFHLVFPLLVCIPYAGTLYSDEKTKYTYSIFTRVNKRSYLLAKIIAQFAVGFATVMFALLTSFILTAAILPAGYPFPGNTYQIGGNNILGKAFFKYPLLISMVIIIAESIVFAVIGCVSFVFAYILDNGIVVMVSPFALYFFESVVWPLMGNYNSMMENSYILDLNYEAFLLLIVKLAVIVVIILISCLIRMHKKDEI